MDTSTTATSKEAFSPHHPLAVFFAFIAAIGGVFISFLTIWKHLTAYHRPRLQRYILRLLLFVPLFAVFSTLILFLPLQYEYFVILRDIWESVVVYSFFSLILAYCGGENGCAHLIREHPGTINHPWPASVMIRFLQHRITREHSGRILNEAVPCDIYLIKFCKRCIIAFSIIQPFVSIISITLKLFHLDDNILIAVLLQIIYNFSVLIALYVLLLFYIAVRDVPSLVNQRPMLKFLSIKLIIAGTWYQLMILSIFFGFGSASVALWNNMILCMELPFIALLQYYAFPLTEIYSNDLLLKSEKEMMEDLEHTASKGTDRSVSDGTEGHTSHIISSPGRQADAVNSEKIGEAVGSTSTASSQPNKGNGKGVKGATQRPKEDTFFKSVKDTVFITDVVNDAYYNFNTKYNDHTLLIDYELEEENAESV